MLSFNPRQKQKLNYLIIIYWHCKHNNNAKNNTWHILQNMSGSPKVYFLVYLILSFLLFQCHEQKLDSKCLIEIVYACIYCIVSADGLFVITCNSYRKSRHPDMTRRPTSIYSSPNINRLDTLWIKPSTSVSEPHYRLRNAAISIEHMKSSIPLTQNLLETARKGGSEVKVRDWRWSITVPFHSSPDWWDLHGGHGICGGGRFCLTYLSYLITGRRRRTFWQIDGQTDNHQPARSVMSFVTLVYYLRRFFNVRQTVAADLCLQWQ